MKLSPIVVFVLVFVAGLILLYLVARLWRPFGHSLGFVCAVAARLLVTLTYHMKAAAAYCNKACLASFRYPPGISGDGDYWRGVNVIARLALFALAISVLAAEPANTLLVLPALFQTTSTLYLPGVVELASAALFITAPALWGCAFLETCGLIPHGAGMFPPMGKWTRVIVGLLSGVFLVLAILITGYLYLFRAVYLIDPQSTQGMSLYILGGLGLVTAGSAVLALWAFVVGAAGVVSLLLWIAENILHVLAAIASFLPEQLDILAFHLTGGEGGVWGKQIERPSHTYPTFLASRHVLPEYEVAALLPQNAVSIMQTNGTDAIVSAETPIQEVPMSELESASIVFVSRFGTQLFPLVRQKIVERHVANSFRASAVLDLPVNHVDTAIPGVRDLTPAPVKKNAAVLHGEKEGQAIQSLFTDVCDQLVEIHQRTKGYPAPLVFPCDCRHLVDIIDGLENIHRRLQLHPLLVVTEVSKSDLQEKIVQVGLADLQSLVQEDVVTTIMVTSPHALFASTHGGDTQRLFEAHTLVSLVIAQKHSLHNPSCTDVLKELHTLSPFTTIASASEGIAVGHMPKRWSWVPGVKHQAGTGSYGDILAQTKAAIDQVITEEDTRMFPAQVQTDAPSIILSSVPVALNDSRHLALVRDNALYVASHYPFASSITVRGNGCSYPRSISRRFLVQASCLYPLQPASLLRLEESRTTKVTPLFPVTALEPTNGNGHKPTKELPSSAKPMKARATTRQKKAAPTRRVIRKNSKQAK